MMPDQEGYKNHLVFTDLDRYIEFYEYLADSVSTFVSAGTKAIYNIDSYLFSSIQGTMSSIRTILLEGRINDAYALLRKYYDSAIINIYSSLYLEDHVSIENFIVRQIDNWLNGTESLPTYRVMSQYIRDSARVAPITELVFGNDRYKRLRDRCNDHTHYNFFHNVLLNDPTIRLATRHKALAEIATDVRDVLILHVAYLFFIKGHYMGSSDYIDALECGQTPEPDSQYWVAPFVQEILDDVVRQHRPDIAAKIREHSCMQLK